MEFLEIVQLRQELNDLRARVAKIEAFVTDGTAAWPMSPSSDQAHTSKTDDKAEAEKLMAEVNRIKA